MTRYSKKAIASVAALQILLYHCWIPIFRYETFWGSAERFLLAATYSGVDVFFFISAFSLVSHPVEDYWKFIRNRTLKLLPLFLIALLAGQFLWFIPSIMVMYLLLPPLYRVCRKRPLLSFFLLFAGWALLVYVVLGIIRPPQDFGIFLFRIPGIILGAYAAKCWDKLSLKRALISGIVLLAIGLILVYNFGYINKLNTPFRGMFYLMGIPIMLGTVLIVDKIASKYRSNIIARFGSMTLELYFSQMVLGTALVNLFFPLTRSKIATNIAAISAIIIAAVIINKINDVLTGRLHFKRTR